MPGYITVYPACMFAGKTDTLITAVENLHAYGNHGGIVFYHVKDTRSALRSVQTHTGKRYPAVPVSKAREIIEELVKHPFEDAIQVVAIDEAQFFDPAESPNLLDIIRQLVSSGKRVIVAGLDLDFREEPYALMPAIVTWAMAWGGDIYHLKAVCQVCGDAATMTQRLVDGKPAPYTDPVDVVGGAEMYQARCRTHHEIIRD